MFRTRTILVIGAHPDDAVLGAGAFIAHCAGDGASVTMLSISSGELAGQPLEREAEDREAARLLGADVRFARLPDGAITQAGVINAVTAELKQMREPLIVLAHDPSDAHQDHVTVGRAAIVACRDVPNLFLYEGPSTIAFDPQCTTQCDEFWPAKMAALETYASQSSIRKLIEWADCTGRYRAWPRHTGSRCEAFRIHHADLGTLTAPQTSQTKTLLGDFSIVPKDPSVTQA